MVMNVHPLTFNMFVATVTLAHDEQIRPPAELRAMLEEGIAHPTMMDQIEQRLYPGKGSRILNDRGRRVSKDWPGEARLELLRRDLSE